MRNKVIVFLLVGAMLILYPVQMIGAAGRNDIMSDNITLQAQVDYYTNEITMSGHVEVAGNSGLLCSFTIASGNTLDISNAQNQVIAFEMISTDEHGNFTKTVASPKIAGGGTFTIKFNCENMTSAIMQEITVKSSSEINTLLGIIASASEENLETLIRGNNDVLKVNLDYFELYSEKFRANLFNGIGKNINNVKPLSNFRTLYNNCASLISVQNATGDELIAVFVEYADLYGIDVTGDFETVKAETTMLFSELAEGGIANISEVSIFYNQALAIAMVNSATREGMTIVLANYNYVLELDLSGDYISLGKLSVNQGLVNKNFNSIKAIQDAFENKIAELKSNSSSTGGGGRSSATTFKTPTNITVFPSEEQSKAENEIVYFSDLGNVVWAKTAINTLYKKGIVSGYNDGTFLPNDKVTREEFLKMLMLALNISKHTPQGFFEDVDENSWYASYVYGAFAEKIVQGISQNVFGIGENVERQDVAVMCHRALKNKEILKEQKADFKDLQQISDYAQESVELCYGAHVLNGNEDGSFMPRNFLTRAEATQVIYNVLSLLKGSEAQ